MTHSVIQIEHRLAWLAGIIDGEGSISLGLVSQNRFSHSGEKISVTGRFEVHVGNTDEAMLNEVMAIADVLGIGYAYVHQRSAYAHYKPCNRVVFMAMRRVKAILTVVYPYLITKRARAEVVLRMIEHRQVSRRTKGSREGTWRGCGQSVIQRDAVFLAGIEEMAQLNGRLNRRGMVPGAAVHMTSSSSPAVDSLGGAVAQVVGAEGDKSIPTQVLNLGTASYDA